MDVKPVSYRQTPFNGYIGPNLKKYVNIIVKNNVNNIVQRANQESKPVDTTEIINAKSIGDSILNKFTKYMAKTEKNTVLDLNDIDSSYMRLIIQNPIAHGVKIDIYSSYMHNKPILRENMIGIPEIPELNESSTADNRDLDKLKKYMDYLLQINPKAIDKTFLGSANFALETKSKKATGFWAKREAGKLAKKIDEFAKDIGEESTATIRVKEYFKIARENKANYEIQKQLENANKKTADKILNS